MNARTFILLAGVAAHASFAQGTFQNLNFESGTVVPVPGDPNGRVLFAPAFPGWTGTINGQTQAVALYNDAALGSPSFGLLGPGSPSVIDGSYSARLQAISGSVPIETALFQTGLIPSDSLSLQFFGSIPQRLGDGQLTVSLNQTPLSIFVLQTFGTYSLYAADISSFAGQIAELRFRDSIPGPGVSGFRLDTITFSPTPIPVPEPSTWALLTLGSILFWRAARRRRE